MEHPHDPYHVRPFPQQPKRGGKELIAALDDLEIALSEEVPNTERFRMIQARLHKTTNEFNDERLIDLIRQISQNLEKYQERFEKNILEEMQKAILKVRVELKHL